MRKRQGSAADCSSTADAMAHLSEGLPWSNRLPVRTLHELLRLAAMMIGDLDHARQQSTWTLCVMNGILLFSLRSGTSVFQQVIKVTSKLKD